MNISLVAIGIGYILLLRTGQMLFETGVSRSKNAASAILRSICDLATCALAFWAVGGAILLQSRNAYLGLDYHLMAGETELSGLYLTFALIATGQVTGALAERARFGVVPLLSALMAIVIVPVIGHWTWVGFLRRPGEIWPGVLDLGGAIPLHLTSATVALVAAGVIGPRNGKYNRDGSVNGIPGHNVTLMGSGVMLMFSGWLGYLVLIAFAQGDTYRSVFNGLLAGAAGALAGMLFSAIRYGKAEVLLTMLGMISGMASVTAGLGFMPSWGAVLLALLAGVLGPWVGIWLDVRGRIDEASGMASAIAVGALVSLVGSPLLLPGVFKIRLASMGANLLAASLAIAVAGLLTWGVLKIASRFMKLRASEADEYDGLDLAEHDVNAYPDFQQTMIKSYHLREA
jgi:Amt family ammonium transporter